VADPARLVPLSDVVALDEMFVEVLAVESVVAVVLLIDAVESAEVEFTLDAFVVVLGVLDVIAVVGALPEETPAVWLADSRLVPEEPAPPEPAPEDDPAVFEAVAPDVGLVCDDWM
jgi:hypothetical protein